MLDDALHPLLPCLQASAETSSEAQIEAQLRALAAHAPDYLALRPYGSCGTPALWVDRSARANDVMARLRSLAEQRHSIGAAQAALMPAAAAPTTL